MYYYVFEQPENKKVEKIQEKLRINLEDLRIIGEATKANPVQKPEELVASGITKGYNTIVIVGSDDLINRMATYVVGRDVTLGMIPTDPGSKLLKLIGAKNADHACEILPFRRIIGVDVGRVEDDKYFLTKIDLVPAVEKGAGPKGIDLDSASSVIDFGGYKAQLRASRVTIENGNLDINYPEKIKKSFTDGKLDILTAPATEQKEGFLSRFFKKETQLEPYTSLFHSENFRISASPLMAIISGDKIIGRTPVEFSIIKGALKIIVSRTKED